MPAKDKTLGGICVAILIVAMTACFLPTKKAAAGLGQTDQINSTVSGAYRPDKQEAAFGGTHSTAEVTTSSATILAGTAFPVGNRQTINLSARFSASGKSCKVIVFYVWNNGTTDYIKGRSREYTITGPTVNYAGVYMAEDQPIDTAGATHLRIVMSEAPTGGATVTFWVGSL